MQGVKKCSRGLVLLAHIGLAAALVACSGSGKLSANAGSDGIDGSASADIDPDPQWAEGTDGSGTDGSGTGSDARSGDDKHARSVEGHAAKAQSYLATFPGFRMFKDGTSRVFVEVSAHVDVAEAQEGNRLTYRLKGVRVPEHVNRLGIPTTHFATPVALIRLVQVDDDAQLIIDLRVKGVAHETHLKRSDGGTVVSVDFPEFAFANNDYGRLNNTAQKWRQYEKKKGN